ncbi:unnamed protein product (macronuclear) [Paramecium tetraurelia]|uniref:Uncharacterized protein n=1 Tax=Paramecium tetraurelia TaxID=5888 RepID=A0CEL8_PARTE|nr:uncharacterized protein GSPATT00037673001 [Paramecium tetraurelia]CAK69235.1 unnamed protein product [Paramecium tetraurelia]|eukprot:XP_001436632.1 hypothetical protein (macronuclear) [Paramecium tetraurelia strain d4-2]
MSAIPKALLMMHEDINHPINQMSFMKDVISIQQYTFKRIIEQQEVKSKSDSMLVNQNLSAHHSVYETYYSDHLILVAKSNYRSHIYQLNNIRFIQLNKIYTFQTLQETKQIVQKVLFRDIIENYLNSMFLKKSINTKKAQIKIIANQQIAFYVYNQSETAFKSFNRLLIMNPSKRDGGIMNSVINKFFRIAFNSLPQFKRYKHILHYNYINQIRYQFQNFNSRNKEYHKIKGEHLIQYLINGLKKGIYEVPFDLWSQETADLILNFQENCLVEQPIQFCHHTVRNQKDQITNSMKVLNHYGLLLYVCPPGFHLQMFNLLNVYSLLNLFVIFKDSCSLLVIILCHLINFCLFTSLSQPGIPSNRSSGRSYTFPFYLLILFYWLGKDTIMKINPSILYIARFDIYHIILQAILQKEVLFFNNNQTILSRQLHMLFLILNWFLLFQQFDSILLSQNNLFEFLYLFLNFFFIGLISQQ